MSLSGHLWTLSGRLRHLARPPRVPESEPWTLIVDDPRMGPVSLTGALHAPEGAETVLVVVHGLGGCADATYARRAAQVAAGGGLAAFRFNMRGSDRSGEDYYHAGLTSDLAAAIGSPELSPFRHVLLLGYSLGGHVALRYATGVDGPPDERLRAVAAVSSPLDLEACCRHIDRPALALYRRYLLRNLAQIYGAVADRQGLATSRAEASKIRTFIEWDGKIVAPRHGFESAVDYYRRASVAPHLSKLRVPTLLVASENDPMVPIASIRRAVEEAGPVDGLEAVLTAEGGHVGFPEDVDLGLPGEPGIESQAVGWLAAKLPEEAVG